MEFKIFGRKAECDIMEIVLKTELDLPLLHRGKVREMYELGDNVLMIATDRVSAFDVVFEQGIARKGEVLNKLALFWFRKTEHLMANHIITDEISNELPSYLKGRSVVVKKCKPIEMESVVRGYITGSAYKEYKETGEVVGMTLPEGLKNGDKLEEPIFTPAIKAKTGHDENINEEKAKELFGDELVERIKQKSIELYRFGHEYLQEKGLVLADTKFEFGTYGDELVLIDEVLTPDSSRYWDKKSYEKGNLVSFDKQFLRDYLEGLDWDKKPPAPKLPAEIIEELSRRYVNTYKQITGEEL